MSGQSMNRAINQISFYIAPRCRKRIAGRDYWESSLHACQTVWSLVCNWMNRRAEPSDSHMIEFQTEGALPMKAFTDSS